MPLVCGRPRLAGVRVACLVLASVLLSLAVVAVGCGGGQTAHSNGTSKPTEQSRGPSPATRPTATRLPQGCRPPQVRTLFDGFLGAINSGNRTAALRYIAPQPELMGFTIYRGRRADAGFEARTPSAVYGGFARLVRTGGRLSLLRGAVGRVGPFVTERRGPTAQDPTAGVDFVVGLGSRSAAGKAGINCTSGRFYVGAMDVIRGIQKEQLCGGYVHLHAGRPVVCAYQY